MPATVGKVTVLSNVVVAATDVAPLLGAIVGEADTPGLAVGVGDAVPVNGGGVVAAAEAVGEAAAVAVEAGVGLGDELPLQCARARVLSANKNAPLFMSERLRAMPYILRTDSDLCLIDYVGLPTPPFLAS
jgi:hypothetical protein